MSIMIDIYPSFLILYIIIYYNNGRNIKHTISIKQSKERWRNLKWQTEKVQQCPTMKSKNF